MRLLAVLVKVLDVLLPVITKMVNLSLDSGIFASDWKLALVLPLLKPVKEDVDYKNFRPVSNLQYVSRLTEKVAAAQLIDHLSINRLHLTLQSAYKLHHSTESALLKVKNEILIWKLTKSHYRSFSTLARPLIRYSLKWKFGIVDNALKWFKSYLSERSQRVGVNRGLSNAWRSTR